MPISNIRSLSPMKRIVTTKNFTEALKEIDLRLVVVRRQRLVDKRCLTCGHPYLQPMLGRGELPFSDISHFCCNKCLSSSTVVVRYSNKSEILSKYLVNGPLLRLCFHFRVRDESFDISRFQLYLCCPINLLC